MVNTQVFPNAPSAIALTYLPALPAVDRRLDQPSLAFPLAYYPANSPFPGDSIAAPTSPPEIVNFDGVQTTYIQNSSGSIYVNFVSYSGSYSLPITINQEQIPVNTDFTNTFYLPSQSITLNKVVDDSTATWYPVFDNGLVWQDTVLQSTDTTSWLWNIPGVSGGQNLRLFYTLPQNALWYNYDDAGKRRISADGTTELLDISNAEGSHISKGDIYLDSTYIYAVQNITEISIQGYRTLLPNSPTPIIPPVDVMDVQTTPTGTVTFWDGKNGALRILPAPSEDAQLLCNYTKERFTVDYRGFWDDTNNCWQALDLNPTSGRIYNPGIGPKSTRETEDLIYRPVSIYLLPTCALLLDDNGNPLSPLQYYSAYKEGRKDGRWHPLRHYVPDTPPGSSDTVTATQQASWGYATLDVSTYPQVVGFSAADRGIPLNQESALLIANIRVSPKPRNTVQDARRFSGLTGAADRQSYTSEGNDPRTNRWDLSAWEGLSAPLAASVLVEVSNDLINNQGVDAIKKAVDDNLPPGIVSIVRPMD